MAAGNVSNINVTLDVNDKGTVKVRQFAGATKAAGKKGAASFASLRRRINDVDHAAVAAKAKMMAIAAATAAVATTVVTLKKAISAASDLQEVTAKFSTVFAGQVQQADAWAQNLVANYAMSTREARQYLAAVQDLLVPMGMAADKAGVLSNEIVKLAADLASFNNLPTAQVMENIQSALTGEYESMKKYGIVLNATIVQQKALNMGLAETKDALSAADKAQAAYKLMLEDSAAAQGDMARTQDSFANTLKKTKALYEDFLALLGQAFLPVATEAMQKTNAWAQANGGLAQKSADLANVITSGAQGMVRSLRFVHNAFLGLELVANAMVVSIAASWKKMYDVMHASILKPLDLVFDALVKMGKMSANPLDKLDRGFGDFRASAVEALGKVEEKIAHTNQKYDTADRALKQIKKQMEEISADPAQLNLSAKDQASPQLDNVARKLDDISTKASTASAAVAGVTGGGASPAPSAGQSSGAANVSGPDGSPTETSGDGGRAAFAEWADKSGTHIPFQEDERSAYSPTVSINITEKMSRSDVVAVGTELSRQTQRG